MCKLPKEKIDEIRNLYLERAFNQYKLAKMYGVSQGYISNIVNNKNRKEA